MPISGTANGQDVSRRAALQLYNEYGGNGGAPQAAPQQGGVAPAGDTVAKHLAMAVQLTEQQPQMLRQNTDAWRQAIMYLQEVFKSVQGQQGAGPAPAPGMSPGMAAGGAQAAPTAMGRPPR